MVGVAGIRAKKSRMNGVDSQVPSLALGFFKYIGVQEEASRGRRKVKDG